MASDEWYQRLYADDPSTDNIFGREDLAERRHPAPHAALSRGARLGDCVPPADPAKAARLLALMDRLIAGMPRDAVSDSAPAPN